MTRVWFQETKWDGLQLSDPCTPGDQTSLLSLWANIQAQTLGETYTNTDKQKHTCIHQKKIKQILLKESEECKKTPDVSTDTRKKCKPKYVYSKQIIQSQIHEFRFLEVSWPKETTIASR